MTSMTREGVRSTGGRAVDVFIIRFPSLWFVAEKVEFFVSPLHPSRWHLLRLKVVCVFVCIQRRWGLLT